MASGEHQQVFLELTAVLASELGCEVHEVTMDTPVQELGIDGSDAEQLLAIIAEQFNVNFDKFDFYDYFQDEGFVSSWVPSFLVVLFPAGRRWRRENERPKRKLPIRELIQAIESGHWAPQGSEDI